MRLGEDIVAKTIPPRSRPPYAVLAQSCRGAYTCDHLYCRIPPKPTHMIMRPRFNPASRPATDSDQLTVFIRNVPLSWGTGEVYDLCHGLGASPNRIEVNTGEFGKRPGVTVHFTPPPKETSWLALRPLIRLPSGKTTEIEFHTARSKEPLWFYSTDGQRRYRKRIAVEGSTIVFGILQNDSSMLALETLQPPSSHTALLEVNLQTKRLELSYCVKPSTANGECQERMEQYVLVVPLKEIRRVDRQLASGKASLIFHLAFPPFVYRQSDKIRATHDPKSTVWDDRLSRLRQVTIPLDSERPAGPTQLQSNGALIDVGRWLAYQFVSTDTSAHAQMELICGALYDQNVQISHESISVQHHQVVGIWDWLRSEVKAFDALSTNSPLSALDQMADTATHFSFDVLYQLEVCLSQGLLHESYLTHEFALRLANMDASRARRLLERAADLRKPFHDPMDLFKLQSEVSHVERRIPSYCTLIRSVIVTPTTVYFNTPMVETSNRILRKYRQFEDRFLRVKFRDETYRGRIMTPDDNTCDEIFARIKRTMMHGIQVGDRHYEFLAFGNSQFREHGAYFFAPTHDLTPDKIRQLMGTFTGIKVIAKYASRLGQSFSTTRATSNRVHIVHIPDIERNGFCFTDGVGKMSLFMAQMIAQDMGVPSSAADCPSVYQFRLAGCKGVLTVSPDIKGPVVHVRPSQNKFPAEHWGLEICRFSQFSTVFLNQQIILVLSALGVPDQVFLARLRRMLSDLEVAMHDETMALRLLQKSIDLNQTTVQLAHMIIDGFMQVKDPFVITCLRLWRSWSIKYLKEKAKIMIDQGAFVLGCVDETSTLRGQFYGTQIHTGSQQTKDIEQLPEIFLQISEYDPNRPGVRVGYRVIEGICLVARNPSLHPGDVRVVNAVDKPSLRHIRDAIVFPQTGDRDLPGMCSGGDLDGDDFLVVWDPDLLPREWNHPAMNYSAPDPLISEGPVTIDAITTFFVQHMKYDNLPRIATAHRYWADRLEEGVKHEKCLELAALHSCAVDYAKTGVPAAMPPHLRPKEWPHWAEKSNVSRRKIYHSNKVLGRLYDEVQRVDFVPAWHLPFDKRILDAYELDDKIKNDAKDLKTQYDDALRRLMAQHDIKSEFEAWSTFVMSHNDDTKDWKLAEVLGETLSSLKQYYQELAFEKAGTNAKERDRNKMRPFICAMYTVTAKEIAAAKDECAQVEIVAHKPVPARELDVQSMPFMSFPWLFQRDLGQIAREKLTPNSVGHMRQDTEPLLTVQPRYQKPRLIDADLFGDAIDLPVLEIIQPPKVKQESVRQAHATALESKSHAGVSSPPSGLSKRHPAHQGHFSSTENPTIGDSLTLVDISTPESAELPTHVGAEVKLSSHLNTAVDDNARQVGLVAGQVGRDCQNEPPVVNTTDPAVPRQQPVLNNDAEEQILIDLSSRSSGMAALDRLVGLVGL